MNKIREALQHIPADDRDTWVRCGMAIQSEIGADGFDIWDEWSRSAGNYNSTAARNVWKSFKSGGITIASLYKEAKSHGWADDVDYVPPSEAEIQQRRKAAAQEREKIDQEAARNHAKAAKKAGWILHQTVKERHAYLDMKGFPELLGMVWHKSDMENLLCIPMRVGTTLTGLQMIDRTGQKKFLFGQRSSGAEYVIDNHGVGCRDWYCEGYGTALSLRAVLSALKLRYRIHATFSANNLTKLARRGGLVIADHDESGVGEKAAIASGCAYWMPATVGTDLNDEHKRLGIFRLSQEIRKWLMQI
jgi:putative DNA primase/helicase